MNLVNLSTAVHRVAKIMGTDPRQQGQLRQHANLETLLNSVCTASGCHFHAISMPFTYIYIYLHNVIERKDVNSVNVIRSSEVIC